MEYKYGKLHTGRYIMLLDHDEPMNYEEVMMSPDSAKWLEAMKYEMGSMYENKIVGSGRDSDLFVDWKKKMMIPITPQEDLLSAFSALESDDNNKDTDMSSVSGM
ncbi:hypothetical protein TRIUR3_33364 [Triticum urartu]|uniref:Retrovirus-related Pol polyprotein from transposon TNT 1-94 n=1 Tax=Triticum urartu TaxID=4572 RepID=M8A6Z6_TRIUA|nr:hypothetical protein TRIUR3_33364 [Triticum urartu]